MLAQRAKEPTRVTGRARRQSSTKSLESQELPSRLYPNRLEHSRLDTLRRLLADNPANTFARYGLAMEHVRSGDLDGAVQEFEAVLATDANYSAA
jgi:thioredoxin-like negative regulator of GroEL